MVYAGIGWTWERFVLTVEYAKLKSTSPKGPGGLLAKMIAENQLVEWPAVAQLVRQQDQGKFKQSYDDIIEVLREQYDWPEEHATKFAGNNAGHVDRILKHAERLFGLLPADVRRIRPVPSVEDVFKALADKGNEHGPVNLMDPSKQSVANKLLRTSLEVLGFCLLLPAVELLSIPEARHHMLGLFLRGGPENPQNITLVELDRRMELPILGPDEVDDVDEAREAA